MQSVLDNFGVTCINREPTHFYSGGCSLIDLLLTNNASFVFNFNQVSASGFSKHDVIFASLDIERRACDSDTYFRDYKRIDNESLQDALLNIDWSILYSIDDPDIALDFLNTCLVHLYNCFVPLRKHVRTTNKDWFNNDILHAMIERDLAYRSWIANKNEHNHNLYKRLRNRVTHLINVAKSNYVSRTINGVDNSKHLWSTLNRLNVTKTSETNLQFSNTKEEINDYFANNFSVDSSHIPLLPPNSNGFYFCTTIKKKLSMQ